MYCEFIGRHAKLFNNNKQIIRQFNVSNEIINVQVSGEGTSATIAITMKNGKTIVYRANGQIVRR